MSSEFPEIIPKLESYSCLKTWRERLGRYRIMGSRCKKCGEIWFPSRKGLMCPVCYNREMDDHECAHAGEITEHNAEVMGYPAMGYGELAPRNIVMIKLDDGVHILSEVVDASAEECKTGTRVKMVLRKHRREDSGNWLYGYKFVLE
jgi:uncharacterized OB-fold protein